MEDEIEELKALLAQEPENLTPKGHNRLNELRNKHCSDWTGGDGEKFHHL